MCADHLYGLSVSSLKSIEPLENACSPSNVIGSGITDGSTTLAVNDIVAPFSKFNGYIPS